VINNPTVFVLGAGASSCFGFPLGVSLCQMVVDQMRGDHQATQELVQNSAFERRHVEAFRSALWQSGQNSIDAFLETRTEFLDIGKAAMATLLIKYENADRLFGYESDNWMRYLFPIMRADAPNLTEFAKNKVSFVTFNFDRSLDQFLFTSLQNTYGGTPEELAEALKQIPLIHLHGKLGNLPWQPAPSRHYTNRISSSIELKMCVDSIKVVHEELQDGRDKDFENAKRLMGEAKKIYFLGFGFGPLNVQRLGLGNLHPNISFATGQGFTQAEANAAAQAIEQRVRILSGVDIQHLLRNVVDWS